MGFTSVDSTRLELKILKKKITESSKKQNLNLPRAEQSAESTQMKCVPCAP